MFIRMYVGLLLAIMIALGASGAILHWHQQQRFQLQLEQVFSGTLAIVLNAVERHQGEKLQRWLAIAGRLSGSDFDIRDNDPTPGVAFHTEPQGEGVAVSLCRGQYCASLWLRQVNEQHLRTMATLLINELVRDGTAQRDALAIPASLRDQFAVPVTVQPMADVALDRQQLSRLQRSDTVVVYAAAASGAAHIYARIPGRDQVVIIGPVIDADQVPVVLASLLLLLSLTLVAGTAYLFIRRLQQRLSVIDRGVNDFAERLQLPQAENDYADDVGRLSQTVVSMSLKIRQLLDEQHEMIRAVGHELRTPMSRLQFRLQRLSDTQPDAASATLDAMKRDLSEMNALIAEILELERVNADAAPGWVNLSADIERLRHDLNMEYPHSHIHLALPAELNWYGDRKVMMRLMKNLMENACKYGGGQVNVKITLVKQPQKENPQQNTFIQCCVSDNGPGIAEHLQDKIFTAFYRIESSRSKNTGGLGLGLAIVKKCAQRLGGQVWVENQQAGGARFCLRLAITDTAETKPGTLI